MKTIKDYDDIATLIAAYRHARNELEKASRICGGYLHYNGHSATNVEKSDAEKIRETIMINRRSRCLTALTMLAEHDLDVANERREVGEIK